MAARPSKSSYYGKKRYNFKDSRNQLQPDMKGFLCTCNYGEKDCQKEAINLLREYSEEKDKPSEDISSTVEESTDIMDSLDTELESLSKKDNADWKKFTPSVTGVGNCLFISTTVEDPCDLMYKILEDIERTKVQKTKFLLRMLPILVTCKANLISIKSACTNLLSKYFSTEPTTFAIMFNHRYNNSVPRDEVIKELANQVVSYGQHTVDLSGGAKMTIIVEVVKSVCCLSVVRDYGRFCKFNLLSVCGRPEKRTAEGENDIDIQLALMSMALFQSIGIMSLLGAGSVKPSWTKTDCRQGDGEKSSSPKVKKQEENDQVKENCEVEENTESKLGEEVNKTSEL